MDADQKKAEKKAKIAAEMERMKAKKAAANAGGAAKAEATTPKTRATTPVRAPPNLWTAACTERVHLSWSTCACRGCACMACLRENGS